FIFTPALFVSTISQTPLNSVPLGGLALSVAVPIIVASGIIVLLRKPLRATGPEMGSSIQGTIRINTYVGLIVANSLGGTQGMGSVFNGTVGVTTNVALFLLNSLVGTRGLGLFSIVAAMVLLLVNIIAVVDFPF